jgi:membrane protein DedA with SNARE-associated domain
MHFPSLMLQYAESAPAIVYAVPFIGMIVEGDLILLAAIYAAHIGFLDFKWVLSISFLGMFIGDFLWYSVGHHFEWFFKRRSTTASAIDFIDGHLSKRPILTLTISKFIYFLHRLVFIRVKKAGIALHTFLLADLVAGLIWFGTICILGIIFAESFIHLRHYIRFSEIGLLIAVLILFFTERLISYSFKKKVSSSL